MSSSWKRRHADDHGVAGAALDALLDERDVQVSEALLLHPLGDAVGAVADDDDGARDLQTPERREDVHDHRATAHEVDRLRPLGAHPGAFSGGKDDGRNRPTAHAVVVPEVTGLAASSG